MRNCVTLSCMRLVAAIAVSFCSAATAMADTIWTDWTSASNGAPGSASGSLGGVTVTYSGQLINSVINGSSPVWSPNSSFIGGTVSTSPSAVGDVLFLSGASTGINTITFASPEVDPVFAIWSLGHTGVTASFIFQATPVLQAGGPNSQFGGQSIIVSGNTVSGQEGNGVVRFSGTFTSLSWTNTFEDSYGFTVGTAAAVPEPSTAITLGLGMAAIGLARYFRGRKVGV